VQTEFVVVCSYRGTEESITPWWNNYRCITIWKCVVGQKTDFWAFDKFVRRQSCYVL